MRCPYNCLQVVLLPCSIFVSDVDDGPEHEGEAFWILFTVVKEEAWSHEVNMKILHSRHLPRLTESL